MRKINSEQERICVDTSQRLMSFWFILAHSFIDSFLRRRRRRRCCLLKTTKAKMISAI